MSIFWHFAEATIVFPILYPSSVSFTAQYRVRLLYLVPDILCLFGVVYLRYNTTALSSSKLAFSSLYLDKLSDVLYREPVKQGVGNNQYHPYAQITSTHLQSVAQSFFCFLLSIQRVHITFITQHFIPNVRYANVSMYNELHRLLR